MKLLKLSFLLFLISIPFYAQNDCSDAITVCGSSGFQGLSVSGYGKVNEFSFTNSCMQSESNSIWLKLSIKTAGTLGFILKPESTNLYEDFDFILFGPNATCNTLGPALRCSSTNPLAAGLMSNHTGMTSTAVAITQGPGSDGDGYVKWITVNPGESYFLVVDRPIGTSNFSIEWLGSATFNTPPDLNVLNATALNIEEADINGTETPSLPFDLTRNSSTIIGGQSDVEVTYHLSSSDAITNSNPILNPTQYKNIENTQTIYTRITNTITQCYNWTSFTIKVSDKVIFPKSKYETCDDTDTNGKDGKMQIDLNKVTAAIFDNRNVSALTINYYLSENDAKSNTNPIPNSFINTIPFEQSIFIRAFSAKLSISIQEIKLIINPLPDSINNTLVQCETGISPSGLSLFNLSEANSSFNTNPDVVTTYHISNEDALNNKNPLNATYTNSSNPQTLFARNTNLNTKCATINFLTLKVNAIPETVYTLDAVCDDDGTEDGLHSFDLTQANLPITTSQSLKYYTNENDALLELNSIQNPSAYRNDTAYYQEVFARIEEGNDCYAISKIKLQVNKLPNLKTNTTTNVCEDNLAYFATLEAGLLDNTNSTDDFAYQWTKDGIAIANSNAPNFKVNKTGTYEVTVTNKSNCTKTRTIEVTASNIATIKTIDIEDLMIGDSNKITIHVVGKGEYVYSLDNPNGPYQESNVFENITSGIHEVYVNDKKNCGTINKMAAVIGAPKYFTPNGDSYNDYWNISGLTASNKNAVIYIYDRFGKLLKQIRPIDQGWDGQFTGKPLPADDYWYTLKLEDNREVKGHFSLKR